MANAKTVLVRMKPFGGAVTLKGYCYNGVQYRAAHGWYRVDSDVGEYLSGVRCKHNDPNSALAFEVKSETEAKKIDRAEKRQEAAPAIEPKDVSTKGDLSSGDLKKTRRGRKPAAQKLVAGE